LLHGEQEKFFPFTPTSPHFHPVMLNWFPNKLCCYFYYNLASCLISFLARHENWGIYQS
jgi:hypothetical protein